MQKSFVFESLEKASWFGNIWEYATYDRNDIWESCVYMSVCVWMCSIGIRLQVYLSSVNNCRWMSAHMNATHGSRRAEGEFDDVNTGNTMENVEWVALNSLGVEPPPRKFAPPKHKKLLVYFKFSFELIYDGNIHYGIHCQPRYQSYHLFGMLSIRMTIVN